MSSSTGEFFGTASDFEHNAPRRTFYHRVRGPFIWLEESASGDRVQVGPWVKLKFAERTRPRASIDTTAQPRRFLWVWTWHVRNPKSTLCCVSVRRNASHLIVDEFHLLRAFERLKAWLNAFVARRNAESNLPLAAHQDQSAFEARSRTSVSQIDFIKSDLVPGVLESKISSIREAGTVPVFRKLNRRAGSQFGGLVLVLPLRRDGEGCVLAGYLEDVGAGKSAVKLIANSQA
ncbi:hypothetical protein DFH06DRAFT_1146293 [Mycena polygramma]|nr:hypothetical protein DFH06DRAFT_1146293 [Mycena polygramma]